MNPPKNRENSITRYHITEENLVGNVKEQEANYDLMAAIMICLGKSDGTDSNDVLKLLDVLLSTETGAADKCQILEDDFQIEMTQTLESEVSLMCNLSKGVEEKGIKEGILVSVRNLMESMGLSAEQAMSALKVPEAEQEDYAHELKKTA